MPPLAVDGPSWSEGGLLAAGGRFPLRVENAVSRLVDMLLPGVITTTRHARYYGLYVLAWAETRERGLEDEDAEEFVRRCEVVAAGVHHAHAHHERRLSAAHGEDLLPRFLSGDTLDVAAAAKRRSGMSMGGFSGVYQGGEAAMRLLTSHVPPTPGPRADLAPLREGLGDILALADRDSLALNELAAASHLCLCSAAEAPDGQWLRKVMFETAEVGHDGDRNRQLTCAMLIDALGPDGAVNPERAFRTTHGFGAPLKEGGHDELVACAWRGAILRNYSVSAWRELWRWLGLRLKEDPMTVAELAETLADEVGDDPVAGFLDGLPARTKGRELLSAEEDLRLQAPSPTRALQHLALGALRLDDLEGQTLHSFIGRRTDQDDLGPVWFRAHLEEWRNDRLSTFARELTEVLVRRAKRVALSKMELREGQVWIPSRLRDRSGVLSIVGEEGAGDVSLRSHSLAEVLAGLGMLERAEDDLWHVTPLGSEIRERLR